MAELSQLHKEWETARQDLKQCEAAKAGAFAAMERAFPAQPKQICGKGGCFPMGMSPLEAWELLKARALAGSKIDGEALSIRKRIGKLKPTTSKYFARCFSNAALHPLRFSSHRQLALGRVLSAAQQQAWKALR